nr:myb/SANT-like domain-containing protein [Tanacetum cinerariifolium]
EEGVSKMMRMLMEEKKEDDLGACIEKVDKVGWAAQDPMAEPTGLEFSRKDLKAGIEEQDLITDIDDAVLDL